MSLNNSCRDFHPKPLTSLVRIALTIFRPIALAILVTATLFTLPAFAGKNGEKVVAVHGEWEVICAKPLGAKTEKCGAVSKVKAADIPDVGLVITFMKTSRNDKVLLRIRAPLGILLPTGLGLKIDDKDVGRVNFVRCTVSGCIANVFIDDTLEKKFKNGNTAMFIIFKTPERGIAIPISLKGLTKAYTAMK